MGFQVLDLDEVVEDSLEGNTLGGRAAKEILGYSPEGEKPDSIDDYTLPNDLLIAIIRDRIAARDCSDGVVIVSLQSKYATASEMSKVIKDALSMESVMPEAVEGSSDTLDELTLKEQAIIAAKKLNVKSGDSTTNHLHCYQR